MFRAGRVSGTVGNTSVRVVDEVIIIPSSMFYTLDGEPVGGTTACRQRLI